MKERELFEITYLPLHISLLALEDAKLPKYLGSTLRGILGQALYKTNREVYKWCCIIKVDTLFSRILIYNHNQYENRRKTYGTESKIL